MNHYTSIEQSKHLLELGLKPETADMIFFPESTENYETAVAIPYNERNRHNREDAIPCWSVGTLLELMPKFIIGKENKPIIYRLCLYRLPNEDFWFVCYQGETENDYGDIEYPDIHTEYESTSLFYNCYYMMVWLLQNNYIKE